MQTKVRWGAPGPPRRSVARATSSSTTRRTTSTFSPWPAAHCRWARYSYKPTSTTALNPEPSTSLSARSRRRGRSEVSMESYKWMIRAMLAGLAWLALGIGTVQAGEIPSTDPATLLLRGDPGLPSVSLYQLDSLLPSSVSLSSPSRCTTTGTLFYRDVTDCWLPEPNRSVFVVINRSSATPTLV